MYVGNFLSNLGIDHLSEGVWSSPKPIKEVLLAINNNFAFKRLQSSRFQEIVGILNKNGILLGDDSYNPTIYTYLSPSPGIEAYVRLKIASRISVADLNKNKIISKISAIQEKLVVFQKLVEDLKIEIENLEDSNEIIKDEKEARSLPRSKDLDIDERDLGLDIDF